MQNDPTHGNSSPHHVSQPTHVEPDQKDKQVTEDNDSLKSENDMLTQSEAEKEKNTVDSDFEKFDIEKVDQLNKNKENGK